MSRRLLRSFGACIALGLTACATDQPRMTPPPASPLVQDAAGTTPTGSAASPAPHPGAAMAAASRIQEPAGKLTLQQALSLALLGNPELAPYSIEIVTAQVTAVTR